MKLFEFKFSLLLIVFGIVSCAKSETAIAPKADYFPLSKIVYSESGCEYFVNYVFEINGNQIQITKRSIDIVETSKKIFLSNSLKNKINKLIKKFLNHDKTINSTNRIQLVLYDINRKVVLNELDNSGGAANDYPILFRSLVDELLKN